ncbi:MAG: hypothetical protein NZ805_13725 [Armatimonadetes bacterium]|nr:hypothetical protein [Armatimonadota bacterium]MDW8029341.1 hypothetical protein [Armatimonadota bacterium]
MRSERTLPAILTVVILGAVVFWLLLRSNIAPTQRNSQPEEIVWTLVSACRKGDVEGYMICFGSPIKERLKQLAKEQGDEKFRYYLKQIIAPIKGIAVFQPNKDAKGNWQVVAEFVFSNRTERQVFIVGNVKGKWKIIGVETSKSVPVLIPYGTLVKGL